MPEDIGYLGYTPSTKKGKNIASLLNKLDQKQMIFLDEKKKLERRRAIKEAKRRLGIIRPKPLGKKFQTFMGSKIRFE